MISKRFHRIPENIMWDVSLAFDILVVPGRDYGVFLWWYAFLWYILIQRPKYCLSQISTFYVRKTPRAIWHTLYGTTYSYLGKTGHLEGGRDSLFEQVQVVYLMLVLLYPGSLGDIKGIYFCMILNHNIFQPKHCWSNGKRWVEVGETFCWSYRYLYVNFRQWKERHNHLC